MSSEPVGVALHAGLVLGAVGVHAFGDEPLAELLGRLHVLADLGHRDERLARHNRRAELARHQPLVDAVDLERIGVERHDAEVGLVAADDRRLQPDRRVGAGRIKCRNYFAGTGGAFVRRKLLEAPRDRTSNTDGCSAIRRQPASSVCGIDSVAEV